MVQGSLALDDEHNLSVEDHIEGLLQPSTYTGIYGFHKYWGKKPVEPLRALISILSDENDIIADPFLGAGAIATEACILRRRFIGSDVNPAALELTNFFLNPLSRERFADAFKVLSAKVKKDIEHSYTHPSHGLTTHLLWENGKVTSVWQRGKGRARLERAADDLDYELLESFANYAPTSLPQLRMFQNSRINTKAGMGWQDIFTGRALRNIEILREAILGFPCDIQRALMLTLTASIGQMSKMVFAITSRGKTTGAISSKVEVGSWVIGYWCPKQHFEINVWNCFDLRAKKVLRGLVADPPRFKVGANYREFETLSAAAVIDRRGAVPMLNDVPENSLQLVVTDPPHGDRIPYLEMSEMWNAVLGEQPSLHDEVVVSNARERGKGLSRYNEMLSRILNASVDRLREGGFIVLLFNSRHQAEWSAIQSLTDAAGVQLIGGLPLNYSARSVVQDNRAGSMKNDMIVIFAKGEPAGERLDILRGISGWTGDPISMGGN